MRKVFIDYNTMTAKDEQGNSASIRVSIGSSEEEVVEFFKILGVNAEISEG